MRARKDLGVNCPILFDGGVRRGSDALKAILLGADCVLVGRPILWGLACGGQAGVERVLDILNTELKHAMITTGCMSIADAKNNTHIIYDKSEHIFKL